MRGLASRSVRPLPSLAQRCGMQSQAEELEEAFAPTRKRIFIAICLLNVFINMDGGVIPATLGEISSQFDLEYSEVCLPLFCACLLACWPWARAVFTYSQM